MKTAPQTQILNKNVAFYRLVFDFNGVKPEIAPFVGTHVAFYNVVIKNERSKFGARPLLLYVRTPLSLVW